MIPSKSSTTLMIRLSQRLSRDIKLSSSIPAFPTFCQQRRNTTIMSSVVNEIKDKVVDKKSSPTGQHLAAILHSSGNPLELTHRATPSPGPEELLIEVKSVALNPIDYYQRDFGFPPIFYPAVLGSDIAGTVVSAGASVAADAPQPGTRVTAMGPCFFVKGSPDYGALQTYALVPAVNAAPLPHGLSFTEASMLPMAVTTVWSGWYSIDLARDTAFSANDKQGILVWGAGGSIGSTAVQVAKLMGFRVYATASEKHHEYLKGLGASRLFDYKSEGVVESIVKAAQEDGVSLVTGFAAAIGSLGSCISILKETKGSGTAKLASAVHITPDTPTAEGIEVKFISAPTDPRERTDFFHFVFNVWLKEKLENGQLVPSPKIKVVPGGLEAVNSALDELKAGVSGIKLVLEL